ncbi:MAG: helix-turn-helix transcriptional regulator, partial [Clostridia bacterium]|nr:helix-turn-helix transcriptional regulator [Clostridia bacterium]
PLFEKLLSVWQSKENGYRTFAKSVLTELLFRFFSEAVRVNRSPKGDNRLRPALQALADVRAEIKVSDLALLCRMSESTFRREFRQVFGVSPAAYRLDRKVLYAKELLLSGELTVGDVAEAVGIRDANYFARLFRRKTGKTPREFASET